MKIVLTQNNMITISDRTMPFTFPANVGNLVFVLLIVGVVIIKPWGAFMV